MTVEQHFARMQQEYDRLDKRTKETAVEVGDRYMSLQGLLDETREAYAGLDERKKANIHVDSTTGIMTSSGDPVAAIMACVVGRFATK